MTKGMCGTRLSLSVAAFLIVGVSGAVHAQVSNPALRIELLGMEKIDQDERLKCTAGDADFQKNCLLEISKKIDIPNTERLGKIFDANGFPDSKMVGFDGQNAFMILLQHTVGDSLRLKAVRPIKKAFRKKRLPSQDYANFIDRLRLHQGKGQLYGSGFEFKDGKMVLDKTQDIRNLEKRRRKIGLPPMSEVVKEMKDLYKLEVEVPNSN